MLVAVLSARGFEVLVAANAADALVLSACHALDAILSDLELPGMSGFDLCASAQRQSKALNRSAVPVWIMTGSTLEGVTKQALSVGARGVFRKPFSVIQVTKRFEKALESISRDLNGETASAPA